jgi:hypothetical protein
MPLQIEEGSLGSPPGEQILHELQPSHWFSAHLHVKYAALVAHSHQQDNQQRQGQGRGQKRKSPSRGPSPPPGFGQGRKGRDKFTKFLALDKCLPRRGFLQVGFANLGGLGLLQYSQLAADVNHAPPLPPSSLLLLPPPPFSSSSPLLLLLLCFFLSATVLGRAVKHAERCTCNLTGLA